MHEKPLLPHPSDPSEFNALIQCVSLIANGVEADFVFRLEPHERIRLCSAFREYLDGEAR